MEMVINKLALVCSAFFLLLLLQHHALAESGSDGSAAQTTTRASTRAGNAEKQEDSLAPVASARLANPKQLFVTDIMRLIHSVRPWPSVEDDRKYADADWQRLIETARILQAADQERLQLALSRYVIHFETSFESDVDIVAEWSKPLLLLRVMFDVSESEDLAKYRPIGCMGFGGFGWEPLSKDEVVPRTLATPVSFRNVRPHLTAVRAGYSGPAYNVEQEYRFFKKNFTFRRLQKPGVASQPTSEE